MKPPITAFVFDLFGTLLKFNQRAFLRELTATLNPGRRKIVGDATRQLMVTNYHSEEALYAEWCRVAGISAPTPAQLDACRKVTEKHLARIEPYPGAIALLAFLRRRGYKLGLLSNTAQPFTVPLKTHGLESLFDRVHFSCETGYTKPDHKSYISLCLDLGILPEQCLFVGDSLQNDYRTPLALGMRAICLRRQGTATAEGSAVGDISELSWLALKGNDPLRPLLKPGDRFSVCNSEYTVGTVTTLPDKTQGRYNLVGRVRAVDATGKNEDFYCKRYLHPEAAHVENAAYKVMQMLCMDTCRAALLPVEEPLLLVSAVQGELWQETDADDPATSEAIGAHCALAYLLGNADLRPRNTFVQRNDDTVNVSVIDLEHIFFERALDLHDLGTVTAAAVDSLGDSLEGRTKHRVLSPAAIRRARKSFLPVDDMPDPRVQCFRQGWLKMFQVARGRVQEVTAFLQAKLSQDPPLIIGTNSYRRPMARIDLEDMRHRFLEDAAEAFERLY